MIGGLESGLWVIGCGATGSGQRSSRIVEIAEATRHGKILPIPWNDGHPDCEAR